MDLPFGDVLGWVIDENMNKPLYFNAQSVQREGVQDIPTKRTLQTMTLQCILSGVIAIHDVKT